VQLVNIIIIPDGHATTGSSGAMASGKLKVGRFMLGVTGYLVEEGMRSWMWATASFALVARMAKLTGVLCGGLECPCA
jgi:hypothetical protein